MSDGLTGDEYDALRWCVGRVARQLEDVPHLSQLISAKHDLAAIAIKKIKPSSAPSAEKGRPE